MARPMSKQEAAAVPADVLELMRRSIALAQDPSYEPQRLDPISRYCPPEIRYDYRGT